MVFERIDNYVLVRACNFLLSIARIEHMYGFTKQLVDDFVKKENIPLEGAQSAEILLGRDTRPSGESLLEAAKQVWLSPQMP